MKSKNSVSTPVIKFLVDLFNSNGLSEGVSEEDFKTLLDTNRSKLEKAIVKAQDIKSKKDRKKLKDPNAPKVGKSAYIFFCMDKRKELTEKHPEYSGTTILKTLGNQWSGLTDKQKEKYNKMAKDDKERYLTEMKSYTPPEGFEGKRGKKVKTGPKKNLTAYIFYCKENRNKIKTQNPDLEPKAITSRLASDWNALEDDGKKKYHDMAAKDKERYKKEKESMPDATPAKSKKVAKEKVVDNEEDVEVDEDEPKPKKSKKTGEKKSKKTKKTK